MEELVKKLNEFLADLNVFYRKLQNYHWNVKGKNFFVLHEKLEEYYNKINEEIDEIAEHILCLDQQPLGTMKDYLNITHIIEAENTKVDGDKVLKNILKDFETLLQNSMTIKKLADSIHIYSTSSLIDGYILEYDKIIWMIKQTIIK